MNIILLHISIVLLYSKCYSIKLLGLYTTRSSYECCSNYAESSGVQCVKHNNVIKIRDGIMFAFYLQLPNIYMYIYIYVYRILRIICP